MVLDLITGGLGVAGSIGGMLGGNDAAKQQAKLSQLQSLIAGTAFSPIGVSMPGGGGITFGGGGGGRTIQPVGGATGGGGFFGGQTDLMDPRGNGDFIMRGLAPGFRQLGQGKKSRAFQTDIGNIGLNLGDMEPMRAFMAQFGGQLGSQLGGPTGFEGLAGMGAGLGAMGIGGMLGGQQGLGALEALVGGQLPGAVGDINNFRSTFQSPLQSGILSAIQDASLTGQQATDRTLSLLREQARPGEERAFSALNENLFGTGRMGTSGGALQTEAFARGLGEADLSRQLAASQEGRAATQQALAQATGLGGLQDSMLANAMKRFSGLATLGQGLSGQRFNQGQTLLGSGTTLAGIPTALQAGQIDNLGGLIQGLTGLTNISTVPANIALNFMSGQSNARLGQATGIGNNMGAATAGATSRANMLSDLGGMLMGDRTVGDVFGQFRDLFG